ncbi:MAG: hypothetical protein EPO22_02665 [Dehalococcoidia bacterium]|nr:MAG: hypothetical protein EPO22_02665 [Dehalococcoidia bacterium]
MADIDAVLLHGARLFYEEIATKTERNRIDDIVLVLREHPEIDDELIFPFNLGLPGVDGRIYYDGWCWIIYRMLNNWTIAILNIGFEEEPPSPRRR